MQKNWFFLKVIICICLFFGYCFMKKEDRVIGPYDSGAIQQMIQNDLNPNEFNRIPVFHLLKDML